MSSNSSLHHTTSNTVAQAEMQEAGAARWSNSSQEKVRELETESEHRECLPLYIMYCLHTIEKYLYVPHPNLESSYIYKMIMTTWPFSCMNVGDYTIKHCWITVIIKYTHGSERYCPIVYMLLWKLLFQAMKTYNTFSITCSASRPKLITISTSILNVVKAELTFTGEGLFCISQCIIVGFLAPSSRSL